MDTADAADLIRGAVPRGPGLWADLGAGDGTFTRALAKLLGDGSRLYAVDRDARALTENARHTRGDANVIPVVADFTSAFSIPGLGAGMLDGILLANALHFVRDPEPVLARLAARVRRGGRVVVVEYDQRAASPWVPYPISPPRLIAIATAAGLTAPTITATRPSAFGGVLYVAAADRIAAPSTSGP